MLRAISAALVLFPITVFAMPIVSGDGTELCDGSGCTTIDAHAAWQPANPLGLGAEWISYADTGVTGSVWAETGRIMLVTEAFETTRRAWLEVSVWADDTTSVLLNGDLLIGPNLTQGTCAAGPIGCEPGEQGSIGTWLDPGLHQLAFNVHQVGTGQDNASNPFGLLYSGTVAQVPEPGSMGLLGAGLLLLGAAARRRRSALLPDL